MFLARRRSGKESANVYIIMESDQSHTAYRIRMPQPLTLRLPVNGILALNTMFRVGAVPITCLRQ